MSQSTVLTDRQANYLDTIFHLVREKHVARVKEIAAYLEVNRSTVSNMLRRLAEQGLISYAPHEFVALTPEGTRMAEEHARRQQGLRDFFAKVLSVDETTAQTAALMMERSAPEVVVERLIQVGQVSHASDDHSCPWCEMLKSLRATQGAGALAASDHESIGDS